MFDRIADLTWQRPRTVLASVALIALVAAVFGAKAEEHLKPAGFTDPQTENQKAEKGLMGAVVYDTSPGIVVLISPRPAVADGGLRSPRVAREVRRLSAELGRIPHVKRVANPLAGGPPSLIAR